MSPEYDKSNHLWVRNICDKILTGTSMAFLLCEFWCDLSGEKIVKNISGKFLTEMCKSICEPSGYFSTRNNGVARAFPGGQLAHPESQNEEENEKSLRKI